MGLKGKSFSVDTSSLDGVLSNIVKSRDKIDALVGKKISKATDIMFRIATQKRPMISKSQMKQEGRSKRVSDPNAEAGVPVQTGALQASIKKSVTMKSGNFIGRIWTSIKYAQYVEFGTSKMRARPFMRPAINISKDLIKQLFNKKDA